MSISDGLRVNATNSNAAWISKTTDDTTTGKLGLNKGTEGTAVVSTQKALNTIFGATGITGENDVDAKNYSSNNYVADGITYKAAIEALDSQLKTTTDLIENFEVENGFANPMTTAGDIIYGGTSGVATRLAGSSGVLQSTGASAPTFTQSPTLVTPTVSNIQFPSSQVASANANNLDDYEEGTFTPTIYGTSTAGAGTYANQVGHYTKIGRQVTCTVYVDITAHTGTGSIGLGGFPFTSAGTNAALSMGYTDRLSYAGAERTIAGYMANGGTTAVLIQSGSALGAATVTMDTSFGLIYSITYFT